MIRTWKSHSYVVKPACFGNLTKLPPGVPAT